MEDIEKELEDYNRPQVCRKSEGLLPLNDREDWMEECRDEGWSQTPNQKYLILVSYSELQGWVNMHIFPRVRMNMHLFPTCQ